MDKELNSITPIDGRYFNIVKRLGKYFSESALINTRIIVECEYFIYLIKYLSSKNYTKKLSDKEERLIRQIYKNNKKNSQIVKLIETYGWKNIKPTNHDVKAVEYYLKWTFKNKINLNLEFIHFGLTSEDVNNISYSIIIQRFLQNEYIPTIENILLELKKFIFKYSSVPFPARTHGQIASPTTFGKEIRVFFERIKRKLERIKASKLSVKLNGAVGNYNAFYAAYPDIDWIEFSKGFIEFLNSNLKTNFTSNIYTTQIEPHDTWVELFMEIKHLNSILIGFCQDIWRYISDELIVLKKIDWEIGSSTMPHKINPIDFENAEGNFQTANALLNFFSEKLPISRMQRDLSDSTVERNFGAALSYTMIALNSLLKGLSKIELDTKKSMDMIKKNPQIYGEGIQTILRKYGVKDAYEIMKEITRGKSITKSEIKKFIKTLNIPKDAKNEIIKLLSTYYTGLSKKIALYDMEDKNG